MCVGVSLFQAQGRLKVQKVPIGDTSILGYDCDILVPCAIGHVGIPIFACFISLAPNTMHLL